MRRFLTVFSLTAGMAVTSANSEDSKEFLDGLAIPDNPVFTGIGAVEKLFGKFVAVDDGDFVSVYQFREDGTVSVKAGPPSGQSSDGTWRTDEDKTCMAFGSGGEFCGITRYQAGAISFTGPSGQELRAEIYDFEPPDRLGWNSSPLDEDFCAAIQSIVSAAPGKFESLIDNSRDQGQIGPYSEPFWYGTQRLWGDDCRVENELAPGYACQRVFDRDDKAGASEFYQANLQQIELCMRSKTSSVQHDYEFATGSFSTDKDDRSTLIHLKGGSQLTLAQYTRSVCRTDDMFDCDRIFGVWLTAMRDFVPD